MARCDDRRLISGDHLRSQITPRSVFDQRRALMSAMGGAVAWAAASPVRAATKPVGSPYPPLPARASRYSIADPVVSYQAASTYNNFYEFGMEKEDPSEFAPGRLKTSPWTLTIDGLVAKPRTFGIDELRRLAPMEERVTRLRCVEGWSMVIPWVGYPLDALLRQVQPLGSAKFVEFTTLADPQQMPGLARRVIRWPYHEGLRLDEARHPLTLLTFGMYGAMLPEQNGAPVRLVVPWKYGFKSIKSIVKIRFVEQQPTTSWGLAAPHEYGFYSNVNPDVNHPRWSQASERVLGTEHLFAPRRKTEMFNGYSQLVAGLYSGMDLKTFY
ncbi:MAG: Sulfoxide reductase catalytic subunit YedY precursor [Pseudomonadota bacterium]